VPLPKVVGTGELPPPTTEIHAVTVDDKLHVQQQHGASAGETHLQAPMVSEHPANLDGILYERDDQSSNS
jgi:hypothetical protein